MPPPTLVSQAGVIPLHEGRLCMVTSRSGRRWVFPKGVIDPGHTPGETALLEAWEEAGLVGTLAPEPLGTYGYEKCGRSYEVTVFLLDVVDIAVSWPEAHRRSRRWLHPTQAAMALHLPALRALVRAAAEGPIRPTQTIAPALCG